MKKSFFSFVIVIPCLLLFFSSCTEENVTNYYDAEKEDGAIDVNIISSSYSIESFDSFHIDTLTSGQKLAIDLEVVLDKPENRSQINKLVIINEAGYGWEFNKNELEGLFIDSLKGYRFTRLLLNNYAESPLFTIKLFSSNNTKANDYLFLLKSGYLYGEVGSGTWYSGTRFAITVYSDWRSVHNFSGSVQWLNSSRQKIGESTILLENVNSGKLYVNDVPDEALYYYIDISGIINDIQCYFKSAVYKLIDRLPANVQMIDNFSYRPESVQLIDNDSKIMIKAGSTGYFIYDYNSMELLNSFSLSTGSDHVFSELNNKMYFRDYDSRIYSYNITTKQTKQEYYFPNGINCFTVIDNFIVAAGNNNLSIINLSNGEHKDYNISRYIGYLIYNSKKKVLYCYDGNSLLRLNINPSTGEISGDTIKSIAHSSSYLTLTPDGEYLISREGKVYRCSEDKNLDITPQKSTDSFLLAGFTSNTDLVTFIKTPSDYIGGLNIYSGLYDLKKTIYNFYGVPEYFVVNGMSIKVFSHDSYYSSRLMVEELNYNDLVNNRPALEKTIKKYYPMKKIF